MEVWNKADLLDAEDLAAAENAARRRAAQAGAQAEPLIVSALTGQGLDELRDSIESRLAAGRLLFDVALAPENGEGLHWLHENTEVMAKSASADGALHLTRARRAGTRRSGAPQVFRRRAVGKIGARTRPRNPGKARDAPLTSQPARGFLPLSLHPRAHPSAQAKPRQARRPGGRVPPR